MKTLDLDAYGVQQMSHQEMIEIDGGRNVFYRIGQFFGGIVGSMDTVAFNFGVISGSWDLQCRHCR